MSTGKNKNLPEYTWQQVATHNTDKSAWVYRGDYVYDITTFLDKHPGGRDMLLLMAGRDITDLFECYHPFTTRPSMILTKYRIGKLIGKSEFARFDSDSGFYAECKKQVRSYLISNNIDSKSIYAGLWRYALIMTLIFLPLYIVWSDLILDHFVLRFVLMIVAGTFQGMLLIHTMHDCSHTAFSHSPFVWKMMGRFCLDVVCGCSFDAWLHQHVVGHHVYTNVLCVDPDCPMDYASDIRRVMGKQKYTSFYKFQFIFLPLIYCLYAFKNRIQDLTQTLFAGQNGAISVNPEFCDWSSFVRQFVCKSFWFFRAVIVPLWFCNEIDRFWTSFLPLFLCMELSTGYFLTYNFQVSHVSTSVGWPEIDDKGRIHGEWAKLQIETCVDYGHLSKMQTFFSGALNYQSVHHLFPSVSQYHYPSIAPIIHRICKKYDVKFNLLPSFKEAFVMHIRQLYLMSKDPEQSAKNKSI